MYPNQHPSSFTCSLVQPSTAQYVRIRPVLQPNPSQCIPVHPSASQCIPVHPNAPRCILMHPNASQCIPMHPNASQCIPTGLCCIPEPHTQTHPDAPRRTQTHPSLCTGLYMCAIPLHACRCTSYNCIHAYEPIRMHANASQ
jgi:hypothetical protein